MNIEVEKRYKVLDPAVTIAKLHAQGVTQKNQQHLIDEWFLPQEIKTRAGHDKWFDEDHGVAYRIRRLEQPDGTFTVTLDSKQLTDDNNHNTFREEVLPITDYDQALQFIKGKKYRRWLLIDKQRHSFAAGHPDLAVTLDSVEGLQEKVGVGAALEIEYSGDGTRDDALHTIDGFAQLMGVAEHGLFDKSLTVTAMDALAEVES